MYMCTIICTVLNSLSLCRLCVWLYVVWHHANNRSCRSCLRRYRQARKRHFLSHLYIKCIILPRQARDKHRENSKRDHFLCATHHDDERARRERHRDGQKRFPCPHHTTRTNAQGRNRGQYCQRPGLKLGLANIRKLNAFEV